MPHSVPPTWVGLRKMIFSTPSRLSASIISAKYGTISFRHGPGLLVSDWLMYLYFPAHSLTLIIASGISFKKDRSRRFSRASNCFFNSWSCEFSSIFSNLFERFTYVPINQPPNLGSKLRILAINFRHDMVPDRYH